MQKKNIRKAVITDICLAVIIMMVYFAAFIGVKLLSDKPALKGNTAENLVGLQIAIDEQSNVEKYIEILEEYEISATFFFDTSSDAMQDLSQQGHSVGFLHERDTLPVMSIDGGSKMISTSIDLDQLIKSKGWEELLDAKVAAGMLMFITADNNFSEFEKIVQIVLNKGYTIVKMEEMFTKEH